jgi:phage terminase large subunit-like protein
MQFFAYAHLPAHLQEVSKRFGDLAEKLAGMSEQERCGDGWEGGFMDVRNLMLWSESELLSNSQRAVCAAKLHEAEDAVTESYELGDVLQLVLEAKDCAVRAVLFKAEG